MAFAGPLAVLLRGQRASLEGGLQAPDLAGDQQLGVHTFDELSVVETCGPRRHSDSSHDVGGLSSCGSYAFRRLQRHAKAFVVVSDVFVFALRYRGPSP